MPATPRGITCLTRDNYISTKTSTVALSLTIDRNFARISACQESARINAFEKMSVQPTLMPISGFCERCASAKIVNLFSLSNKKFLEPLRFAIVSALNLKIGDTLPFPRSGYLLREPHDTRGLAEAESSWGFRDAHPHDHPRRG